MGFKLAFTTFVFSFFLLLSLSVKNLRNTVKLGNKEHFDKKHIGVKELFTDYQPFYTINQLLDKELLPIFKKPKLGVSEHEIVKISKKGGL